jgi:hypothetical protein
MNTGLILAGWTVVVMKDGYEDYGETARRIVRHGFAEHFKDFTKWAGDPGPAPDAKTVYFSQSSRLMFVTQEVLDKLNRYVEIGVKIKMPHKNDRWPSQNMYPSDREEGIDVFTIV